MIIIISNKIKFDKINLCQIYLTYIVTISFVDLRSTILFHYKNKNN